MKLEDYQTRMVDYIKGNKKCGVFAQMGFGKTIVTLTAISDLFWQEPVRRVLIVAPKRVALHTWPEEIKKWQHTSWMNYTLIMGKPESRKKALKIPSLIHITNVDNVRWLGEQFDGLTWPYDIVILDESSDYKSHKSQRFRIMKLMAAATKRVVLLSGTPTSNTMHDIWSQMFLIDQGERLGRYISHFRKNYFHKIGLYKYVFDTRYSRHVNKLIGEKCVSMLTEDYMKMPDVVTIDVPVHLPPKLRGEYKDLENEFMLTFPDGDIVLAQNAAVLAGKLLQYCSGSVYDEDGDPVDIHDEKVETVRSLYNEACGDPMIVVYAYRHEHDRLKEAFPDAQDIKEPGAYEKWNAGNLPMLLLHPKSAGHGLNLQAGGSNLVWFTLPWSSEAYVQTNARLDRRGQAKPVTIYRLTTLDTIETQVAKLLTQHGAQRNTMLRAIRESHLTDKE